MWSAKSNKQIVIKIKKIVRVDVSMVSQINIKCFKCQYTKSAKKKNYTNKNTTCQICKRGEETLEHFIKV